jgi:hypothetical protein
MLNAVKLSSQTTNQPSPRRSRQPKEWVIQRCTQRWIQTGLPGHLSRTLEYEDFPTPEGIMTRDRMLKVLDRVNLRNPNDEFRGHRVKFTTSTGDEKLGMAWWNNLDVRARGAWMARVGTGCVADAWQAFKRGQSLQEASTDGSL